MGFGSAGQEGIKANPIELNHFILQQSCIYSGQKASWLGPINVSFLAAITLPN